MNSEMLRKSNKVGVPEGAHRCQKIFIHMTHLLENFVVFAQGSVVRVLISFGVFDKERTWTLSLTNPREKILGHEIS